MRKERIHQGWKFWKDGQEIENKVINLPHDAMLLEKRVPDMENGSASGFYPGGTYYYEKTIFGKEEYRTESIILEFEGVYMNSTVWLNGEKVGGWKYGYTNFFVNLTGRIKIGEDNTLLVKADNSKTPNARWYSGSGIYRPVNMWTGGVAYIKPQGIKVKTLSVNPTVLQVHTEYDDTKAPLENGTIEYIIYDGDNEVASFSGITAEIEMKDAKLWSDETPHLYQLKAVLKENDAIIDEAEVSFGIRTLEWSSEKGLLVNGEMVKLRGGCIHHDNGVLGACTFDKAEYRKIKKLKEFGFNAIRFSHYPAGKSLLDACDQLGMYVLDESFDQWRVTKTKYDYSTCFDEECEKDIAALAWKDYNHPSVIMYCIGNEITDTGRSYGAEIAKKLCRVLKEIDGTRPVTIANNAPMSIIAEAMEKLEGERGAEFGSLEINELLTANPDIAHSFDKGAFSAEKLESLVGGVFDQLDIAGHNYAGDFYEGIHECRPDRVILSTETLPAKMADNWKMVETHPYVIGDFHWTAWDYLGEAGVGVPMYGTDKAIFAKPYPCLTASCGSFDLLGYPEAAAYYAAIIWGVYKKPYIGVRPVTYSGQDYTIGIWRLTDAIDCWTWEGCEGKKAEIIVYSIGKTVELYQNGTKVDEKDLIDCKAEFEAIYLPGELKAVSMDENGYIIDSTILQTAGKQVQLTLLPEEAQVKSDIDTIFYVPIGVTDENGVIRRMTDKKISVTVRGAGELLALGSGRPETEESFLDGSYTSWHGYVMAVVRCTGMKGNITITASADGCKSVSEQIQIQ